MSFAFLVAVGIFKTVLTKHIFEDLRAPVAMSALSCVVTSFTLLPVLIYTRQCRMLKIKEVGSFFMVCLAIAADLAFTNIGLSVLPLAFQQSIKATLPIATITLDFLINKTRVSVRVLTIVVGICCGPLILSFDKDWSAQSDTAYGVFMLSLSIVAGALKYVLAHSAIRNYKEDMGLLGFTAWMEIVVLILLVPWSVMNGELQTVWTTASNWYLLIGTSLFGGIRILSQFYFLDKTSPTSLAASNIVIQVGLTMAGSLLFHDPVTTALIVGSMVTIVMSASYMFLRTMDFENEHQKLVSDEVQDAREEVQEVVYDEVKLVQDAREEVRGA